jgi:hypothetical protein
MIERDIPLGVLRELQKPETEEALLVFLTISNTNLQESVRVVSDPENFVLDGKEFQGFSFSITLLSDNDSAPKASLTIQNVDERIGQTLLDTVDPIYLKLEVIPLSEFNMKEYPRTELDSPSVRVYTASYLRLTEITGNVLSISGTLRSWDYTQETWPGMTGTEDRLPGLYWS